MSDLAARLADQERRVVTANEKSLMDHNARLIKERDEARDRLDEAEKLCNTHFAEMSDATTRAEAAERERDAAVAARERLERAVEARGHLLRRGTRHTVHAPQWFLEIGGWVVKDSAVAALLAAEGGE